MIDRDFSSPSILNYSPLIFAPRDNEKGGTWIGINEHKIFVNILNRWTEEKSFFGSDDYISRGKLVFDLLKFDSLEKIKTYLQSINPIDYLPFNLIISDLNELFVITNNMKKLEFMKINKNIFIVGNIFPFEKWEKYKFGYNFLKTRNLNSTEKIINCLKQLLQYHKGSKNIPSTDYAVKLGNFQTTSSSIIAINKKIIYKFLNGFPPNGVYKDYKVPF